MDKFDYITATIEEEKVRVEKIIKDKLYDTVIDEMLNKSVKITIETI